VADVIDPKQWSLTLPTGHPGHPDEIPPAQLGEVDDPAAHLDHGGLLFTVHADGVTTAHSDYPRAELRELTPAGKHAAWSPKTGRHTLTVCQAVTALPPAKPQLVTAQIHDAKSDVMQVRLEGTRLIATAGDGKHKLTLDKAYRLGTPYQLRITAAAGQISVAYNGKTAGSMPATGSGWYFKTGAYLQSNTAHRDAPTATGAVRLYSATVNHSAAPSTPPAPTGAARESSQPSPAA
jgi:poly(beta-D-mannuronate) lyase